MPLPNFIILGAPKAGTTSLAYHLAAHPQVCFSSKKEPDFFARYYDRGLDWYRGFFDHWSDEPAIGEGSVHYSLTSWFPDAPARIAKHLPDTRFIYMARHPVNRLESMWTQHKSTGLPLSGFNQSVREWRPLLEGSLYNHQYLQYRKHFPADRFCCLFFEDFITDPTVAMRKVCRFLDIDSEHSPKAPTENRNPRHSLLIDRGPWGSIRNTALGRACRQHVPEPAKTVMRKLFRKPIDIQAQWEETTLRWAVEQVRGDATHWLARQGKPKGFWDFSENYIQKKLEANLSPPQLHVLPPSTPSKTLPTNEYPHPLPRASHASP